MWVGGGQKNYGHPVPDASSHCEGTQRQEEEEEKHAWVMFGQFVRLGVPSCFTLCSKVNACECAAEQGEGGLVEEGDACGNAGWKPIFSGTADKSLHSHDPPFGHLFTFPRPFMLEGHQHLYEKISLH